MRFWQEPAIAASSKFVATKFVADEDLVNEGVGNESRLTFLPSRLRVENFLDEQNFPGFEGLVAWQRRGEGFREVSGEFDLCKISLAGVASEMASKDWRFEEDGNLFHELDFGGFEELPVGGGRKIFLFERFLAAS